MDKHGSLAGWANVGDDLKYDWRNLIPGLDLKVKLLSVLSPEQLKKRWIAAGRPTLSDFGLVWVHITGGREKSPFGFEGVSFINDVRHRKMFQITVDDAALKIDWTDESKTYWEMVATLVAKFAGLIPLHEVKHVPAPVEPVPIPRRKKKR